MSRWDIKAEAEDYAMWRVFVGIAIGNERRNPNPCERGRLSAPSVSTLICIVHASASNRTPWSRSLKRIRPAARRWTRFADYVGYSGHIIFVSIYPQRGSCEMVRTSSQRSIESRFQNEWMTPTPLGLTSLSLRRECEYEMRSPIYGESVFDDTGWEKMLEDRFSSAKPQAAAEGFISPL